MNMPTDQGLSEKEREAPEGFDDLSSVQFSAQITAEAQKTESPENINVRSADYLGQAEREQEEITRRDREILAALDKVLKNSSQTLDLPRKKKPRHSLKRIAVAVIGKGCGLVSLSLTLIMMGITLICIFFSAEPDFTLLIKLAPAAAVFIGIEILLSWLISGRKIRINIPCTAITAVIIAGCCVLSAALSRSIAETEQQFSDRSAEAFIYEESYLKLKHKADILELSVKVDLNLEGGKKRTSQELFQSDDIEITAALDGLYASPEEFAKECAIIIGVYQELEIPVDNFRFTAETRLMSFSLDVEGKYQQDFSDRELSQLVRYVFIEDYDFISDLGDFTEETIENTTEK